MIRRTVTCAEQRRRSYSRAAFIDVIPKPIVRGYSLGSAPGSRSACQRMTWRKLTATMTATTATNRDHGRAPATIRALVVPQDLVNCHT